MSDSEPHPSFGPLRTGIPSATTTSLFPLITVAPNVYNLDEFFSDEEVKN